MSCSNCKPGMMLCESCMSEEEDPKTCRIPRREDAWLLPVVSAKPYTPVNAILPKIRRTATFIPVYEVVEPYDYPEV